MAFRPASLLDRPPPLVLSLGGIPARAVFCPNPAIFDRKQIMDRTTLALLTHELRNQCIYTEAAFHVFNQSLEQQAASGVFYAAQSMLLSASQIGCMLWPPRARAKKRGEDFRKALQLPEKHPLNDKRLLLVWEHADEKFDDWVGHTKGQQIVFDHIGPLSDFGAGPVTENSIYRLYDPTSMLFYFRGDGFKLPAIAKAVADIYSRAHALHRQLIPEQDQAVQPNLADSPAPGAAPGGPAKGAKKAAAGSKKKKAAKKGSKKAPARTKRKSPAKKSPAPKKVVAKKGGKGKKTK